jgi:CO/xanthine dehydrogenase Mo-binding subunit
MIVGTSAPRLEDDRLPAGRGRFVPDLRRPGALEALFVRNPLAHAAIASIDTDAARAVPGVVAVLTAEDRDRQTKPLALGLKVDGFASPLFRPLADGKARHVGDSVAVVLATSRRVGEDACDAVIVEYDPLDPVLTPGDTTDLGVPAALDELGANVAGQRTTVHGDPAAAVAAADAVARTNVRLARVSHAPLDGHGGLAEHDPGPVVTQIRTDQLVSSWIADQSPGPPEPARALGGLCLLVRSVSACLRRVGPRRTGGLP